MDVETYLDIHSFSNKKKLESIEAHNPLFNFNSVPGYETPSGKRGVVSSAEYMNDLLHSREFWLDANDRGYEMNYEVIEAARELAGSFVAKPVGAIIDPIFLPVATIGVEIAGLVLYVEHKAFEWAINHYFTE